MILKKEKFKAEMIFSMKCRTITSLYLHESLFSQVIDFSLTDAHPKVCL